ncbi:hypothetical protein D5086_028400 [Populus alba]|uniref:Uncharacterized protein n=1 Tax=Populus alba TaxID=43335 RepID=A0ACC4AY60_POPAL
MSSASTATVTSSSTVPPRVAEEKTVQEELSLPILLADRVIKSAQEAESLRQDCSDLAKQVDRLSQMLRSAVRLAVSIPSLYDQGGILPLLKLLKEGASAEAQIAAATALSNIASDRERVRLIVDALGISMIVGVLGDSQTKVQISVANLVARMAALDEYAQEEFMRLNVTRPLVSLLSSHLDLEIASNNPVKTSIPSLIEMNKKLAYKNIKPSYNSDSSSHGGSHSNKEREMETPEMQLKLKVSCAEALWKLSRGSVSNSRKITETKGLLCLAKIVEREKGELQFNCLMTIMEITAVAESNADLRRAAFKTNLPAAKAVLDQLLRVIQEESDPQLQIPAIRSIGCLARTFPARETRIMGPLVSHLGNRNVEVATEAAIALGKFACPENFNCSEHSKAIIEFDGVPLLMKLLRSGDQSQLQGLVLLCYLALNAGNSKALEQARALNALEGTARSVLAQHPELKDLFAKAIHHLALYQAGAPLNRQYLAPFEVASALGLVFVYAWQFNKLKFPPLFEFSVGLLFCCRIQLPQPKHILRIHAILLVGSNSEALEQLWTSNSLRGDSSFCSSTNMITLVFIGLELIP